MPLTPEGSWRSSKAASLSPPKKHIENCLQLKRQLMSDTFIPFSPFWHHNEKLLIKSETEIDHMK
jgi:hypothetical protein